MDNSFQNIILILQNFWSNYGCTILQPYDMEMGAGTFHPATTLYTLSHNPWNIAYVQPSRRPTDGRYGTNPNRLQHYYQFQVILKPIPDNTQQLYLDSLKAIGIDTKNNDIKFVEDNWESPTLGAWGLGWEVLYNGMEVSQFTYFQQLCSINCNPAIVELTYGLERLAMYIQKCNNVFDLKFNNNIKYGDIFLRSEQEYSKFNFELSNSEIILKHMQDAEHMCINLLKHKLALPAYDYCIKFSHLFNLLDARGHVSTTERPSVIAKIRELVKKCAECWINKF